VGRDQLTIKKRKYGLRNRLRLKNGNKVIVKDKFKILKDNLLLVNKKRKINEV